MKTKCGHDEANQIMWQASEGLHDRIGACWLCADPARVAQRAGYLLATFTRQPEPAPEVTPAPQPPAGATRKELWHADPRYCAHADLGKHLTREDATRAAKLVGNRQKIKVDLFSWRCPGCDQWHYSGLQKRDQLIGGPAANG